MATGTRVASLYAAVGADLSGLNKGLKTASQRLKGFAKGAAGLGFAAIGTAALVAGKKAIDMAGDFEAAMNVMEVAASSSGTSLETLRQATLAVGGDTRLVGINASQAADAMTEFYRAGLTTNQIMGDLNGYLNEGAQLSGVMRAAVDLQAASEMQLAQASEAVTVAMKTFNLAAEDAPGITDNFVKSADASVASVSELVDALKNVGPTAASFGWSLEETNTALAILSQRGIKGAEAGTALKSMMTNLMRDTPKVTGALQQLGVTLYDASGQMRALPEILGQLEQGLANATEEERNLAIQTLAGTYGMKAMNTLLAEGSQGWENMAQAVNSAAGAEEVATKRTQGFKGAMESLEGAVETFMIETATPFLQNVLTPLVQKTTEIVDATNEAAGAYRNLQRDLDTLAEAQGQTAQGGNKILEFFRGLAEAGSEADKAWGRTAFQDVGRMQEEIDQQLAVIQSGREAMIRESEMSAGALSDITQRFTEETTEQSSTWAANQDALNARLDAAWQGHVAKWSGMWQELNSIDMEGQQALLTQQQEWAQQDAVMAEQAALDRITTEQDRAMKLAEIQNEYAAKIEAARAASNQTQVAQLQAKQEQELGLTQQSFAKQDALTQRALMVEEIQRQQSRIRELQALQQHYQQKLAMQVIQAGAEQGLTNKQIEARLTALGIELQEEHKLAIEHAKLNQEKAKSDQAYAKSYVDNLKGIIGAAIEARQNDLQTAMDKLNQWQPPELPDIPIPDVTGPSLGGGGGAGSVTGATNTVVESIDQTVTRVSDAIKNSIETLEKAADYQGGLDITGPMQQLAADMETALRAFSDIEMLGSDDPMAGSLTAWGQRMTALSSIMTATNKIMETLDNKAKGFRRASSMSLGEIRDTLKSNILPVVQGIHAAFAEVLADMRGSTLTENFAEWGEQMKSVSALLDVSNKAADVLYNKSDAFKVGAARGFEAIRDAIKANVLPVIQGVQAAFAEALSDMRGSTLTDNFGEWADQLGSLSVILEASNKGVETLYNKSAGFASGSKKGADAVKEAIKANVLPVVQGVQMAFAETLSDMRDSTLTDNFGEWEGQIKAISGILGAVDKSVNMLVDKSDAFKVGAAKGKEEIAAQITANILPVIEGIYLAFQDLPIIAASEITDSLGEWDKRFKGINGALSGTQKVVEILTEDADKFAQFRGRSVENIRDQIVQGVIPIVRGIMAAFKTLPKLLPGENDITPSMQEWDTRLGAIGSILENSIGSVTTLVDNKKYIDLVSGGMGTLKSVISDKLIPIITTINDEFEKNLPSELSGSAKLDTWATGLENMYSVIDTATGVVDKLRGLRGTSTATIEDLMSHLGALLGGIQTGAQAAGVPMGPGGGGGINVAVTVNVAGTDRNMIREILAHIEELLVAKLAAAGVYA